MKVEWDLWGHCEPKDLSRGYKAKQDQILGFLKIIWVDQSRLVIDQRSTM